MILGDRPDLDLRCCLASGGYVKEENSSMVVVRTTGRTTPR